MKNNDSRKKVYLEVMRIVACALVIFSHTSGFAFILLSPHSAFMQWPYLAIAMITRINVPTFFMISGALLLGKKSDYGDIIKRKIPRMAVVLLVFETFVYSFYFITGHNEKTESFRIGHLLYGFFSNDLNECYPYWFLYAYLGFLLALPLMQCIAAYLQKKDFIVLIAIHFAIKTFIPIVNLFLNEAGKECIVISEDFSVPFAAIKAFFYPLIGYYLDHAVDIRAMGAKTVRRLLYIAFAGITISCCCTYWEGRHLGFFTENYAELFDYVSAAVFFVVIKYISYRFSLKERKKGKKVAVRQAVCLIGSATFGIYLFDPLFRMIFYRNLEGFLSGILLLHPLTVSVVWLCFSMTLGGTVTLLLKKLPVFNQLL